MLKTFATSLALVFVCFVSWLYFEAKLAPLFLLGVAIVSIAIVSSSYWGYAPYASCSSPQPG